MSHIVIDDEHQDVQFLTERLPSLDRQRSSSSCTVGSRPTPFSEGAGEVIDLTVDLSTSGKHLLKNGELILSSLRVSDFSVRSETFVQVNNFIAGDYCIDFVLVKAIVRSRLGDIKIRGIPFALNRSLLSKLPNNSNEICMILFYEEGDAAQYPELVDINPSDITKEKTLLSTNADYPDFNQKIHNPKYSKQRGPPPVKTGHITCR